MKEKIDEKQRINRVEGDYKLSVTRGFMDKRAILEAQILNLSLCGMQCSLVTGRAKFEIRDGGSEELSCRVYVESLDFSVNDKDLPGRLLTAFKTGGIVPCRVELCAPFDELIIAGEAKIPYAKNAFEAMIQKCVFVLDLPYLQIRKDIAMAIFGTLCDLEPEFIEMDTSE